MRGLHRRSHVEQDFLLSHLGTSLCHSQNIYIFPEQAMERDQVPPLKERTAARFRPVALSLSWSPKMAAPLGGVEATSKGSGCSALQLRQKASGAPCRLPREFRNRRWGKDTWTEQGEA